MYLIVGLGNPGTQYSNTHHNAGFMAVEKLATSGDWKSEHKALTQKVVVGGQECLLAKPQTYMNLSGESVQALMTWYKIKPEQLLVFSDDINLDVGRIRCRANGSHGGQNGLRNIIEKLVTSSPASALVWVSALPSLTFPTGSWRSSRPKTAPLSTRLSKKSNLWWNATSSSALKSAWNAITASNSF